MNGVINEFFIISNYKIVAEVKAFSKLRKKTNSWQLTCFQSLRVRHISIVESTIAGYL